MSQADQATREITPAVQEVGEDATLHLFVLVHGILGCSNDFDVWEERMQMRGHENWRILKTNSITDNVRFASQIGCGRGTYRLQELGADLVNEVVRWMKDCSAGAGRISLHFVCHSLGGIIVRAALPELHNRLQSREEKLRSEISYGHILTLNSPHIGNQGKRFLHRWRNRLTSKDLHKQINLQDDDMFLLQLADPQGGYLPHLRLFKHRTAVAASHWDLLVPFCTAAICSINPFPRPTLLPSWFGSSYWRLDAVVGFHQDEVPARMAAKLEGRSTEAQLELATHAIKLDSAMDPSMFWNSYRTWRHSDDGDVNFLAKMLTGLASTNWRRIVYTVHRTGVTPHTFTIGRPHNSWSEEFMDLLIDILEE